MPPPRKVIHKARLWLVILTVCRSMASNQPPWALFPIRDPIEKMKSLLILLLALTLPTAPREALVLEFGNKPGKISDWVLISDNIMGGVSRSRVEYTDNSVQLSGVISLDNYGGFASLKTRFSKVDLSGYKGVRIRFRSTDQRFAFTLEDSQNWTRPNYKNEFRAQKDGTWETATIYFKDFKETVIGEPTGRKMDPSVLKNVVRMGIITTQKKEGAFSLEIERMEFF